MTAVRVAGALQSISSSVRGDRESLIGGPSGVGSEAEPSAVPIYFAILRCPSKGASAAPSEPPPRDRWRRQSRRSNSDSPTGSRSSAMLYTINAAWHVDRGRDDAAPAAYAGVASSLGPWNGTPRFRLGSARERTPRYT